MSKDQFKGLFSLWIFVVIFELVWLYIVTTDIVILILTLIVSTLAIGSLGIYLVSKNLTESEE